MFKLKPKIKESAIVEFRYRGQQVKKSTEWLEKNVAVAIGKYHLEYLFEATPEEVEKFIKAIERRVYQKSDARHPDNPGYEMRHIRQFTGDAFDNLDLSDLEAEVRGVPEQRAVEQTAAPKPPKPNKPK